MWQWINDNAQALSVFTGLGTLLVWLLYAQLLLASFRRQRQPRILINQGWGSQIDSICLISNMSHEPIYIQNIAMTIDATDGDYSGSVTDLDTDAPDGSESLGHITRQGPLASGAFMNTGTFRALIRQVAHQAGLTESQDRPIAAIGINSITLDVMTSYGPETGAMAFSRRFIIEGEDNERIRPATIDTTRLGDRFAREQMQRWIRALGKPRPQSARRARERARENAADD